MMEVWSMSDVGLVRKENQDDYAVEQLPESGYTLCVVCDGMGGPAGGRQASHIAVETFVSEMKKQLRPGMSPEQLKEVSAYAVSVANRAVRQAAQASMDCRSMGTTLVSAVSYDKGTVVTNVGDSRAYHISSDGISRVTKDHSLVESMVDRGDITAEEARHHPNRNLITRALGPDMSALSDGYICPMAAGDFLLLCSDGLVETVTDQEMLFEVLHGGDLGTCMDRLLAISKANGASDNVTAVLMQMASGLLTGSLLDDIWSGGNFGRYDNRRKQRPKGYWSGKWYTLVRLLNRCIEMGALSPGEAFWYPIMVAKHSFQMQWKRLTHRSTN